ncbi:MAG: SseB family protein [Oscillospiraceae bacterium]|jgi:hypothetical protein|nr:SseB family protein [Oscillospiraceae bacterium]
MMDSKGESQMSNNNSSNNDFPDWDEALREYETTTDAGAIGAFETRLRGARYLAAVSVAQTAVSALTPEGAERRAESLRVERVVASMPGCGSALTFFTSVAEMEKLGNIAGQGCSEVTFQQLYDETICAKDKIGAVINPGGRSITLSRYDLNRLADLASGAGQDVKARERVYHVQTADAWHPELQSAFAGALSRCPRVQEAYIVSSNVAWRCDEQELSFAIDFDGRGDELYPYLAEVVAPHLDGAGYRFEKLSPQSLQKLRSTARPVYVREDIAKSAGVEVRDMRQHTPFADWDSDVTRLRDVVGGADGAAAAVAMAAFETKLYASCYHVPLDNKREPMAINHKSLGMHLPIFTDRREMLKVFGRGVHVEVHPLPAIYAMLLRRDRYSGAAINIKGNCMAVAREWMGAIDRRMSGMELKRETDGFCRIMAPQSVPPGLAGDLEKALASHPGVRAVFYLSAQTTAAVKLPLAAIVCGGREDAALHALAEAMRRSHGDEKFLMAKANAELLRIAGSLALPLYARGGSGVPPQAEIIFGGNFL